MVLPQGFAVGETPLLSPGMLRVVDRTSSRLAAWELLRQPQERGSEFARRLVLDNPWVGCRGPLGRYGWFCYAL